MFPKFCCFVGHSKIKITHKFVDHLINIIKIMITEKNVEGFFFGDCSNEFEELCHDIVTDFQNEYPHIVRVAYKCHSDYLVKRSKNRYDHSVKTVFKNDEELRVFDLEYLPDSLYVGGIDSKIEKNNKMIDQCDYCIFYYNKDAFPPKTQLEDATNSCSDKSVTSICYDYATKCGKRIYNTYL